MKVKSRLVTVRLMMTTNDNIISNIMNSSRLRKRKRNDAHQPPPSSKALKVFVLVGTPIIFFQLAVVFRFFSRASPNNKTIATSPTDYDLGNHDKTITISSNGENRNSVGSFNGYAITFQEAQKDQSLASSVHCIGESYAPMHYIVRKGLKLDMSWQHRSCKFNFFCYDLEEKEYVIFENPSEKGASKFPKGADISQSYMMANQTHHMPGLPFAIAIGGLNSKWTREGVARLKWYPKIRNEPPENFYALSSDVVMIPFHSLASFNPGHLVWDDFLPIYSKL